MTAPDPAAIVKTLGGRWRGRHGMCRCPAHDDRTPSLSVTLSTAGIILVNCRAGCSQAAVLAALRGIGLWPGGSERGAIYAPRPAPGSADDDRRRRIDQARDLWNRAALIGGTLAETYLRSRGIRLVTLPPALHYLPSLEHWPTRTRWPAMLAALTDETGAVCAVQRTYLARDGRGKAPVEPQKMTLGFMGDGAVRLGTPSEIVGLAEGVETALSAKQAYRVPTWAALGCKRFATIAMPADVRTVVIFADRGKEGWNAANDAADRFEREGRSVEIILPPSPTAGDFNDWLREGTPA